MFACVRPLVCAHAELNNLHFCSKILAIPLRGISVCVCARAGFSRLACLLSIEAKSEYCICKFQFFNSKQILCIYVVDFLSYSISSDPVKKLSRMNGDILHRHSHQTLSLHFPFRPQFSSSSVWLFSFSLCSNHFSLSLYAQMARINSY